MFYWDEFVRNSKAFSDAYLDGSDGQNLVGLCVLDHAPGALRATPRAPNGRLAAAVVSATVMRWLQ